MKARAFVLITTVILLGAIALGTASGIDNCCFVDRHCTTDREWNDGFHAFHHNQCPAPAQSGTSGGGTAQIDNCCYVDRQCHSDQDWINGYHAYQNGQCQAPAQSPAPASSQPAGGAPTQVDNCCFVDRQCHSDQDWLNGYHAYQNGQCQAPAQSPAPVSSQPAGGAPAQVDNCCYVDRQCNTDLDWRIGWHAYRTNRCGAAGQAQTAASSQPGSGVILRTARGIVIGNARGRTILPSTGPSILPVLGQTISRNNCCEDHWQCNSDQDWAAGYRAFQNDQCALPGLTSIVGDPGFIDLYERALDLLRTRLPHRYNYVLDGVDKVEQREGVATGINPLRRTFFVRRGSPVDSVSSPRIQQLATALVHEACHVHRSNAGYRITSRCDREGLIREEAACVQMELDTMIELNDDPVWIQSKRNLIARIRSGEHMVTDTGC